MNEERVLIYVQGNKPEEELLVMKEALAAWASLNQMNVLINVTEGVQKDIKIWERDSIFKILHLVRVGIITTILTLDENMISKDMRERYLFYHFVQLFGGNVRTKEKYVDDVKEIYSYNYKMNQLYGPLWLSKQKKQ